jgi:hypothetical protein
MMMKTTSLNLVALLLAMFGSASEAFVSPATKTTAAPKSTTQVNYGYISYGDRTSWDGSYTLGSSFLQNNMFNDPYAFERRHDRNNKDDIKRWGYYDDLTYHGVSSLGKRQSPMYIEDGYGYGYNYYSPYYESMSYGYSPYGCKWE